jgi:hypothetical protein
MSRIRFEIVCDWPDYSQGQNIWAQRTPAPPARRIILWLAKTLGRRFGARVIRTDFEAVATAGKDL